MSDEENFEEVQDLVERICPILHGHEPGLQGSVLADLVARWVAGHYHEDGDEKSEAIRAETLDDVIRLIKTLVPFHVEIADEMRREGLQ